MFNVVDIQLVAAAYGAMPGDDDWNPAYDSIKMVFDQFMSGTPGACEELPPGSLFSEGTDEGALAQRLGISAAQGSDGDGLSDLEEYILGTYANDPDSDSDGINDVTEFLQGSDPADGLPVSSGVIASAATQSPALDVCVANNVAAVVEGNAGVELFDVFNSGNPVLVGRIETPGSADRLACSPGRLTAGCASCLRQIRWAARWSRGAPTAPPSFTCAAAWCRVRLR